MAEKHRGSSIRGGKKKCLLVKAAARGQIIQLVGQNPKTNFLDENHCTEILESVYRFIVYFD